MIKKACIILVMLSISPLVNAQQHICYNRTIGSKSLGIALLKQQGAMGGKLLFEKKLSYPLNYRLTTGYFQGQTPYTSFRSYGISNTINYEIYRAGERLIVHLGAGLTLGLEEISSRVETAQKTQLTAAIPLEMGANLYFTPRLAVFSQAAWNYNYPGLIYQSYLTAEIGFRIILL